LMNDFKMVLEFSDEEEDEEDILFFF
jgi:hypothetical protein